MRRFQLESRAGKKGAELKKLFKPPAAPKAVLSPLPVHNADILNKHAEWYGLNCFSTSQIPKEGNYRLATNRFQFDKMVYPRPGLSTVHMIWSSAPCNVTCWNDGNSFMEAYRSPEIETFVVQHPWMENDCYFADIILPVCTKHEMHE
jgi:trimethylamine-N-oxide reductase (cytochrome c)